MFDGEGCKVNVGGETEEMGAGHVLAASVDSRRIQHTHSAKDVTVIGK